MHLENYCPVSHSYFNQLAYFMGHHRKTQTMKENIKMLTSCGDVPMLGKKT